MADDAPLFEVTTAAATAAARRITTAAYVAATMSDPTPSDEVLEAYIDEVSAKAARYCGLADDGAHIPTFASEILRATWFITNDCRDEKLLLPWRVPVTSITSVVENDVTLTASTDYRLLPGGTLLRLCNDYPINWYPTKIVVVYVAGWATLSTNAPPDLQAAIAEQVKYRALAIDSDPGLRSYTVNDLRSETFNVPGGDSISKSGLLVNVEAALDPYRSISL